MKTQTVSTKLDMYKQALTDKEFACNTIKELSNKANSFETITISNSLSIRRGSSELQYIFALGVLNSQIASSTELGLDPTDLINKKTSVKDLFEIDKEYKAWAEFYDEICTYVHKLERLLTDDERFQLIEYPTKP